MRLALIGAVVEAMLALAMSEALASTIVMVNTFDALAYPGGTLFVLAACSLAGYLRPAGNANRSNRNPPVGIARHT